MVSKYLIWIKVPSDMSQFDMAHMTDILREAFKDSQYGFFVVPDKFDVMNRAEIKEWLENLLQEMNLDTVGES